ncbi:hypothetical protein J8M21_00945 [Pseudoalteromonas luteoviolacea]|uniref:hypothetical protein n=1 Tax=Pseudoalteromonas luteoviolacea TaxID=43657 RepID=UPI001B377943|nr:hypothetical protein [Pseudoalteromonas luteoviolacea]MBQ4875767.1 hypothetical protein [Pseudoalteromonas luteoviolacea]MBQ4904802.1 hypothetical protein [Pseudoalteromonas luteoviolacea]
MKEHCLELECPSCQKLNRLPEARTVKCGACKSEFNGFVFSMVKGKNTKLKISIIALVCGVGGYQLSEHNSNEIFSSWHLYEVVSACANKNEQTVNEKVVRTQQCLCAWDNTIQHKDIIRLANTEPDFLKVHEEAFLKVFSEEFTGCNKEAVQSTAL